MDLWRVLVLGVVRLGGNNNDDRLVEQANDYDHALDIANNTIYGLT
jgi:hypothetical protein